MGPVKCTSDLDKVKFHEFLCEERTGTIYYNQVPRSWDIPSYWPTLQEFQDLLRKKFRELYPAPTDEVRVAEAADIVYNNYVNYEEKYNAKMQNIAAGKTVYTCPARQNEEIKRHQTYDCISKEEESPSLTFRYNNGFINENEEEFNKLPKNVKDQNAFGFVLTGELGDEASFPKYLIPGQDANIPLRKKCYEAVITFDGNYFHVDQSLPVVTGLGPLPDECKKTLRCSVHWCGDDPSFTLEAQSNSAFKFKVESQQKGIDINMVPFTFKASNPYEANLTPYYCLQKAITVAGCKKSIYFTAPELDSPRSLHTNRLAIVLAENSDASVKQECFKFPFEWNFGNWQLKRDEGGAHDVSQFFQPSFKPPIEITEQSDVSLLDIAHNVGGGLAVYKDVLKNKFIIQACNPEVNYHSGSSSDVNDDDRKENYYMELRQQGTEPKGVAISDSGTVAVVNDGSNKFHVYVFDLVKAKWIHTTTITQSIGACRIALSTHGHFFAILTSNRAYLYQKDLRGSDYGIRNFEGVDYISVSSTHDQISIYASESGVVSLQTRDSSTIENENSDVRTTRVTREVRFT